MKYAREKISILEDKISVLMSENQNLKIRAAISFDELTPRPSFDKVQLLLIDRYYLIFLLSLKNFSSYHPISLKINHLAKN